MSSSTSADAAICRDLLLLYHRLWRLWGGYGVGVTVYHLPGAIFRPEDHRGPKRVGGDLLASADLGLQVLYLHDVCELGGDVLGHDLEAPGPAVPAQGGGVLRGPGDPVPPAHGRAVGVGQARVFSMGVERLHGLWVAFHEPVERQLVTVDELVYFSYSTHPEITSTVAPFPKDAR